MTSPVHVSRYLLRKMIGWLVMIVVATNLTYFLANAFLDPSANYLQLRPPRTPEQIGSPWFSSHETSDAGRCAKKIASEPAA